MGSRAKRGAAAAATVVVAAAVNVTTGMLTQHWAWAWGAATITLVLVGAATQVWLTAADGGGSARSPAAGDRAMRNIDFTRNSASNAQMRAEASGQGRVYQAGRDQTVNEK